MVECVRDGNAHIDHPVQDEEQSLRFLLGTDQLFAMPKVLDHHGAYQVSALVRSESGQHRVIGDVDAVGGDAGVGVAVNENVFGELGRAVQVGESAHPPVLLGAVHVGLQEGVMGVDQHDPTACPEQLVPQIQQQPAGNGGHLVDAPDVQHDDVEILGTQVISRITDSAPANSRSPCSSYTRALFPYSSSTACSCGLRRRRDGASTTVVGRADRGPSGPTDVHEMQLQILGKPPAGLHAAHAVAVLVQAGGEHRQPDLTRQHGENAAAHAAFGGQTRPR